MEYALTYIYETKALCEHMDTQAATGELLEGKIKPSQFILNAGTLYGTFVSNHYIVHATNISGEDFNAMNQLLTSLQNYYETVSAPQALTDAPTVAILSVQDEPTSEQLEEAGITLPETDKEDTDEDE